MLPLQSPQKEIVIRGTNAYEMKARLEMQLGYDFVRSFLYNYETNNNIPENSRLSYNMPDIQHILIDLNNQDKYFQPKEQTPFVISFTGKRNDPKMWEEYGKHHCGVCLAFDEKELQKEALKNEDTFILNVIYNVINERTTRHFKAFVEYIIETITPFHNIAQYYVHESYREKVRKDILQNLCPLVAAFIKSENYIWEDEIRWISIKDASNSCVHTQKEEDYSKSYIKIPFPITCLKQVYLGRDCPITQKELTLFHRNYGIPTSI